MLTPWEDGGANERNAEIVLALNTCAHLANISIPIQFVAEELGEFPLRWIKISVVELNANQATGTVRQFVVTNV